MDGVRTTGFRKHSASSEDTEVSDPGGDAAREVGRLSSKSLEELVTVAPEDDERRDSVFAGSSSLSRLHF
jgi:hypothetical protein